ncbi:MAG: hypothetical protein NTW86_03130 [Candidatus Sumerlaeota bacterium]|nr:hypothetical protein [Candidatus Sumerlaeota bacterium]
MKSSRHIAWPFAWAWIAGLSAGLAWAAQSESAKPMGRGPFVPLTEQIAGAPLLAADQSLADAATDDDSAAVAAGPDGRIAVAWVAFDDASDRVFCAQGKAGGAEPKAEWSAKEEVAGAGDYFQPAVAFDGQGVLWAVWSSNIDGAYKLFARRRAAGGWEAPVRLTNNRDGSDFASSLVLDTNGQLHLAWQGVRDGNFEILLADLGADGLKNIRNISEHPASDWAPSLAAGPNGKLLVAWDSYRNGSYDVYLREVDGAKLSEPIAIAATPRREANACVAVARDGTGWIAYDVAEENWGRGIRLHNDRSVELRAYRDGRVGKPAADFMASLSPALRKKTERPKIAFDAAGRLQLAFMHFVVPAGESAPVKPAAAKAGGKGAAKAAENAPAKGAGKGAGKNAAKAGGKAEDPEKTKTGKGIFYLYSTALDAQGWQAPRCLNPSAGRGDDRARVAVLGNGQVWAAWAADGRQFPYYEVRINSDVCAARIDQAAPGEVALPVVEEAAPTVVAAAPDPESARERKPQVALGGESYMLLFGDTHRHTDMSRCNFGGDSTLADTYRYGIDVAQLDFLSISDHDQDLAGWRFAEPHPILINYWWWQSQKMADLNTIPGRFLGMYGYERGRPTVAGGGHKNIMSAMRGAPVTMGLEPQEWFAVLKEKQSVVIPHQLADGSSSCDWTKWGEPFERVAEIFQARGSYEYHDAPRSARIQNEGYCLWDALEEGVRVGIVASSDHGFTHGAYAGVFAKAFTRDAIVDAVYDKRTFGSTMPFQLAVTLDGRPMGQEMECAAPPKIQVAALSTSPIAKMEVVKNNEFVYSAPGTGATAGFEFTDADSQPGSTSYYYVRVSLGDKDLAWSSPFWVKRK